MTYEELLLEYEKLKKENAKLKSLLKKHDIKYDEEKKGVLSVGDKINIYNNYFIGRKDTFAEKYLNKKTNKKGYSKTCKNKNEDGFCSIKNKTKCQKCVDFINVEFTDKFLYEHMLGKKSYGIYPIVDENKCYFLCIDFDDDDYKNVALAYKKECDKNGIDSIMEISQSGNGVHVWLFFKEVTLASIARKIGDYLLTQAIINNSNISFKSYDRFLPAQDKVDSDGYGNLIALPLQGECVKQGTTVFVDDEFNAYSNQIEALSLVKKLSKLDVDILIKTIEKDKVSIEITNKNIKKLKLLPSDFLGCVEIILKDDIYISKKNLSNKVIVAIKRLAVIHNPEFYEKQAKRISTYNISRIIELYDETIDYIAIPRGCYDDLILLLSYYNAKYEIKDQRCNLKSIDVKFKAVLRDNQLAAVNELMKYDNGLLIAEPGSGKTIMGMSIIEKIKKPTIILVEKVKLLEQWQQRLNEFLNVYVDGKIVQPGVYYGAKKKLTGIIDIVSIKSLNELSDVYDKYEIVLGDEIHHIASLTYEDVIRRFHARHIYGFTATPERSDHLEKIVYKSISPIRSILAKHGSRFEKILKPRFTKFKDKLEYKMLNYAELCNELYKNEIRNQQIVDDILFEYNNGKNIIVLTLRVEHVEILKDKLKEYCENIVAVTGSFSSKEKKLLNEQISKFNNKYIIIATASYLGEGFDLPSLDTLFLTMPFKWKGSQTQYLGRIERDIDGKNRVTVYDYVDIKIGMFSHQFQQRLKVYKKENYLLVDENNKINILYSYNDYFEQLVEDIHNSDKITFMVNFMNENRFKELLVSDNIKIISDLEIDYENIINIHSDLNVVIINDSILWYGSINPFCYPSKEDTILRIDDKEYVSEICSDYNLKKIS